MNISNRVFLPPLFKKQTKCLSKMFCFSKKNYLGRVGPTHKLGMDGKGGPKFDTIINRLDLPLK